MSNKTKNRGDAKRNSELGYCPCGDEVSVDCECFGTYRLSVVQGLIAPEVVRTEVVADCVPPSTAISVVDPERRRR